MEGFNEKDWKLFQKKLPGWQENFMNRLNKEYIEILLQEGKKPSDIFWELEGRIKSDRKLTGVIARDVRRTSMEIHIINLLSEGAITLDDLSEFSEGLQESIKRIMTPVEWEDET